MSDFIRVSNVKKPKPKPALHQGLIQTTNNVIDYRFRSKKCNCNNGTHALANNGHIFCEDGAKIMLHKCKSCKKSLWLCSACSTSKNVYTKSEHAHRHKRKYHKIKAEVLESSHSSDDVVMNEEQEESLAISNGFNDLNEKELNNINFISDLCKEKIEYQSFIKHVNEQTEKKHLVAVSQDGNFTSTRCENVSAGDVKLQLKLAKLLHELKSSQQLDLCETLRMTIDILEERNHIT